jgi:hypothetical protein
MPLTWESSASIVVTATGPLILASFLPSARVGVAYSQALSASGGQAPYTWALVSATPNTGSWVHVSSAGVVSGTPTTAETETVVIRVTDSLGATSTAGLSMTVIPALVINTTSPLPTASVGSAYNNTMAASGGVGPYTWAITSDTPDTGNWLTCSSSGVLTGTPTTAETESLTIKVTDSLGFSVSGAFSLQVQSTLPSITTGTPLPSANVGSAYTVSLAGAGGVLPYTWTIADATPDTGSWLSINTSTGVLSGTPGTAEVESISIKLRDSGGNQVTKVFSLTVQAVSASSTVFHTQSVVITGSGFGTKSRALAPIIRDYGQDGAGNVNAGYAGVEPNWSYAGFTNNNLFNRALPFTPVSTPINGPHPFVQAILAGAHYNGQANTSTSGGLGVYSEITPIPSPYPFVVYASWWQRADPGWSFTPGESTADNNYKLLSWGDGTGIQADSALIVFNPGSASTTPPYVPGSPQSNTTTNAQAVLVNNGSTSVIENPDGNGHNFYWLQDLSPFNPQVGWIFHEIEVCFDQRLHSAGGKGYVNYYTNGVPLVQYVGRTDDPAWSSLQRYLSFMGGLFVRDYGPGYNNNTAAANNWEYGADVLVDATGGNVSGNVARVIFGNQPTLAASTTRSAAIPSSWSATSIQCQFWQSAFFVGQTVYAHVVTEAGTVLNNQQQFTVIQTPTFDFYISNTGNDSNAGTLTAPWAITSLISTNSNNSKMAGKRVGLIAGLYNLAGTAGIAGTTVVGNGRYTLPSQGSGSYCALSIPPGTASASTYVASCDTNGKYLARAAKFFLACGQNGTGSNVWNNALIGIDQTGTQGYVTIDGITVNANGMDSSLSNGNQGAHICFAQSTNGSFTSAGTLSNFWVNNCELYGIAATDNGGNDAAIWFQGCVNSGAINNYIHDINKHPADASHCHAIESYGCTNLQWLYNWVTNCSGGAMEPKEGNSNITTAYNYIYNCGNSGVGNSAVFQAWDGAEGNPNSPNIGYFIHHNIIDSCGRVCFGESNNANHSMPVSFYSNTIYNSGEVVLNAINGAVMKHYANLYVKVSGANTNQVALSSGGVSPLAYDAFYNIAGGSYTGIINGVTETTGLLTGHDPLFIPGTANIVPGGGAGQFALQSTSPCKGVATTDGTTTGAPCDMGAWGYDPALRGPPAQIGCNFGGREMAAGHYASFSRLSGGASNYTSIRLPQYNSDVSFGISGLTGYIVTTVWADWEPGLAGTLGGDYTISAYINDIQTCANNGKVIGFKILTYGSGSSPNGVIPNYMWNSSNALYPTQLPCYYGANPTAGQSLWRAIYANPFVQQQATALYNFLLNEVQFSLVINEVTTNYTGFNSCPYVVLLGLDEETQPSNVSACISANGYGTRSSDGTYYYQASTWAAGYEATLAACGQLATTVQIKAPFNQLPQFTVTEATTMASTIVGAQATFGAPDLQPSNPGGTLAPGAVAYSNEVGVAAFLGTLGNTSALGIVPYIGEMEGDDMPGGSLYNGPACSGSPAWQGCQWLFNFATGAAAPAGTPAYTANLGKGVTQIWWQILPNGNTPGGGTPGPAIGSVWHTDVLSFINAHPFPNTFVPQSY